MSIREQVTRMSSAAQATGKPNLQVPSEGQRPEPSGPEKLYVPIDQDGYPWHDLSSADQSVAIDYVTKFARSAGLRIVEYVPAATVSRLSERLAAAESERDDMKRNRDELQELSVAAVKDLRAQLAAAEAEQAAETLAFAKRYYALAEQLAASESALAESRETGARLRAALKRIADIDITEDMPGHSAYSVDCPHPICFAKNTLAALPSVEPSDDEDMSEADHWALEVLCRVFDDGVEEAMPEWRAWYKPEQWLGPARALGAFIAMRLLAKRELAPDERAAVTALQDAMQAVSGKRVPVEISMGHANAICRAIATPPRPSVEPVNVPESPEGSPSVEETGAPSEACDFPNCSADECRDPNCREPVMHCATCPCDAHRPAAPVSEERDNG